MQYASGLGAHGRISIAQAFAPQDCRGVLDAEARGIERHHDFRDQRFPDWLSGFAGDQVRHVGLALLQHLLEPAKDIVTRADAQGIPARLGSAGASNGGAHFSLAGAIEFAQDFARRGIY